MRIRTSVALLAFFGISFTQLQGHDPRARTEMHFPDILGFKTLKCDFHIHTVFSDGAVWPDIRPEEAWREGLDAIAITDHIEYQPHKDDLPTNHNRSFEIARPRGDSLQITVIRGSEVTRDMPPGHLNAIFITDAGALDLGDDWRSALAAARDQGAFIFWNHPGWTGQQEDGVARWYAEHDELLAGNMMHGIEVTNEREYYPEAHRWCLEKNLTMLSNSDIHNPLNLDYHPHHGDHSPVTLVFARDKSVESIREALFDRRTVVYSAGNLIGIEKFLRPLFYSSIEILNPRIEIQGNQRVFVQVRNNSDVDYSLVGGQDLEEVSVPKEVTLQGGKTVLLQLRGKSEDRSEETRILLNYTVENAKIAPDAGMPVQFPLDVRFTPKAEE